MNDSPRVSESERQLAIARLRREVRQCVDIGMKVRWLAADMLLTAYERKRDARKAARR